MRLRPPKTQISLGIHPVWSVFAVRSVGSQGPKASLCGQRRLWLDWTDAQTDQSSLGAHVILLAVSWCGSFLTVSKGTDGNCHPKQIAKSVLWITILRYCHLGRAKRIWYLSPMRAAKVQASLRIRAVSPEPRLLAHTSSESRGTFRRKARSLAPLNGWACAVKICHDGILEDTNSLDSAHFMLVL